MEVLAKQPYYKEIAQYHCELAQAALLKSRHDDGDGRARARARDASRLRARQPAARAISQAQHGRLAARRSTRGSASSRRIRRSWRSPPTAFADAYRRLGDARRASACCATTRRSIRRSTCSNALFTLRARARGPEAAATLDQGRAARNPTLLGLDRLLEAQLLARRPSGGTTSSWSRDWCASTSSASAVQVRQLRLSRAAVLLALSRLPEVGDVLAEAHRDAGRLRLSRACSTMTSTEMPARHRRARLRRCRCARSRSPSASIRATAG